jgi:hypothetical protein
MVVLWLVTISRYTDRVKQPKLGRKLVSALSETKCLFWLFHFYTKTESFDVSIEPKQTEDQLKQFDREHILLFFAENLGVFRFLFFFYFVFVFWLFRFYTETESFDVSIEPKQTEDPTKQFKREYIWVFFRKFMVVPVCFGLLRNRSVGFGCFDICRFETPKQTETSPKQILFRFVSVQA